MATKAEKVAADRTTARVHIAAAMADPGKKAMYVTHANSRIRSLFAEIKRRMPSVAIDGDLLVFPNGSEIIGHIVIGSTEKT